MKDWIKIDNYILFIESSNLETSIPNSLNREFCIDLSNILYSEYIFNIIDNNIKFTYESKDFIGNESIIKSYEFYNKKITLNIKSKSIFIKDKSDCRDDLINKLLI